MFRTRLILVFFSIALLSACTTGKRTSKLIDADNDGRFEQRVTNTENLSQRTLRMQEKAELARALCALESENLSDPDRRIIADIEGVKIYSQTIPIFDMAGCISESLRWGGERLVAMAIDKGTELLRLGVKGAAAYGIAKRVFNNQGVRIDNVEQGATVAVGTDQAPVDIDQRSDQAGDGSTFNTCASEIIEGECVLPAVASSGVNDDSAVDACGIADFCSSSESYFNGECGTIEPEVLQCLQGF